MAHVYRVSANPVFRIDIKDNRLRLIMSVKKLYVYHWNASGVFVKETNDEFPSTDSLLSNLTRKRKLTLCIIVLLSSCITRFLYLKRNLNREYVRGILELKKQRMIGNQ